MSEDWQPIETAPEGREVLLAGLMLGRDDWRIKTGYRDIFSPTGWKIFGASWKPVYWQPLPSPPRVPPPL